MPRSIAGRHAVVLLAAAALAVPSAALAAADDGPPIGRGAVSLPVPFDGEIDEADALRLPEGSYLVQVNAIEPYDTSIEFDLRTWLVDDPQPDDP
jgi:hypothetical protein